MSDLVNPAKHTRPNLVDLEPVRTEVLEALAQREVLLPLPKPSAPARRVPVDFDGEGLSIFVFETETGADEIASVVDAISSLQLPFDELSISTGLIFDRPDALAHLVLDNGAPRFLVTVDGPRDVRHAVMTAWRSCAPQNAQCAGFAFTTEGALGLSPRAVITEATAFIHAVEAFPRAFDGFEITHAPVAVAWVASPVGARARTSKALTDMGLE